MIQLIQYWDTSALLKLYLDESGSEHARSEAHRAVVCTHLITWVEVHAGLAMATRMGRLSADTLAGHLHSFESEWSALDIVAADESLMRRAGVLARQFELRAYDSAHLAAAERVMIAMGDGNFSFFAFDAKLNAAGRELGMTLLAV